ncbi:hypothetical protein IH785_00520 [candidate division KSB1 bacterium]|nr:hypothetical protein [candidate division KSB1 bacterium]
METLSTINKHRKAHPWECDEFQDEFLNFLTKSKEPTKTQYYWHCLDVGSGEFDLLRKQAKCTYSAQVFGKAHILTSGYFTAQAELFTEKVQKKPNTKSEKLKKLTEARNKFYELLQDLIRDHKGKYVAIVNGNVEIDSDKDVLLERVIQKHGYVSMYFDKISDKQKVIKLGHRP